MKDNTTCNTPIKIFSCSTIRSLPVSVKAFAYNLTSVYHCDDAALIACL